MTGEEVSGQEVSRRRFIRLTGAGLGAAAAFGLGACGSDAGGSSTPSGGTGSAPSASGSSAGGGNSSGSSSSSGGESASGTGSASGPAATGALVAAYERPIVSLDPHGPSDVEEGTLMVCKHVYDSLVVREGSDLIPGLAKKWSQTDDKSWTFQLRSAKFHDGSPVTAADVKACLERIAASSTAQAALWTSLDSVQAPDDHTVTIKTSAPLGTMLSNLSLLYIVPAAKLKDKNFFNAPIGSGPYKVDSFTSSDHVNLAAADDYWNGAPKLQALQLPYIPEVATRMTSLKTDQVQVTWSIPPDQMSSLKGADGIDIKTTPSYTYYFNWFNSSRKPFDDARVRQAMWHAIDIKTVVDSLFGDTAEILRAPIPSTIFGYAEQPLYSYDPDKAKQLLSDAGLPNGFSTTLMWATNYAPQIKSLAQAFMSYWAKIGVKVTPMELEQATWIDHLNALDWDMDLQSNVVTTGDADFTLGRLYTTKAHRNGYSNPELDDALNGARESTDQAKRKELYAKACKIIWDEAVGIFPLQFNATYGVRSNVRGFEPSPSSQPIFNDVTLS